MLQGETELSELNQSGGAMPRILLVEDNRTNQELVEDYLEGKPWQLEIVYDGHAAVECFSRARFAAVLMDCHMPVMDGFQATRVIRSLEAQYGWRRTPIIAVTAHALEHDRGQCLSAGMDDYLSKPFSRAQLLEKLDLWVKPGETRVQT